MGIREPIRIASRDNQRLVRIRKILAAKLPDSILIEGRRLVEEAIKNRLEIEEVYVSDAFAAGRPEILDTIDSPAYLLSEKLFASISDTKKPQGIIAISKRPASMVRLEHLFDSIGGTELVLMLENVRDPANVGSVLRAAKAAGVSAVLLTETSADPFSPKALRASMGAAFGIPIYPNLAIGDVMKAAKVKGYRAAAAAGKGNTYHWDVDWSVPTLLMLGSEGDGLSRAALDDADITVTIPMQNDVESLNLAVSCGVIVFEAFRQKHAAKA
ncbi:MAG: RNA methyltransferase [Acidobacteriota bacterium]|nr:MAG: RNA methyltransferase [Acidobacteriota bacterium]